MKHSGGEWIMIRSVLYVLLCVSLWSSHFFISLAEPILPSDLVISRIQITGGTGKTDNDFISIFNKTNSAIDLLGLRLVKRTQSGTTDTTIKSWVDPFLLNPGVIYTWANSNNGFAISINADTSSTQTISSDNGIALRLGSENTGTIIDSVGWGGAQNIFVEALAFAQNPGANEILERIDNQDTNNNSLDFRILNGVMPPICGNHIIETGEQCDDGNSIDGDGCDSLCAFEAIPSLCGNNVIESGEQCDDGNSITGDGCSATCQTEISTTGEVYINEFIADPVSGSNEWIELYTPSSTAINITDWSIEDGGGSKTRLTGNIGGSNRFLIIEKPTGSLNNAGDTIILRNKSGTIIDQISYGDWEDGNVNDNAPTGEDPMSVARHIDGQTTHNDSLDFAITTSPTKGLTNIITAPINEEEIDNELYDFTKTITNSEIFSDPLGIDAEATQGEYIELYNFGDTPVNVKGWYIEIDDGEYIYDFKDSTIIDSKKYLIIPGPNFFKLNNDGGKIKLFQPTKSSALQTVNYKNGTEGQSYSLINENSVTSKNWKWTNLPTPQKPNVHVAPPQALFSAPATALVSTQIQFDSSDSNTGGIQTTYSWNFGDNTMSLLSNPQHLYKVTGTFTVVLTLTNQYGSSTLSKKIKITNKAEKLDDSNVVIALMTSSEVETTSVSDRIILSEIFPNPQGKDEGQEWIEVMNNGTEIINLKNWRVASKTKKGPLINEDIILEPGGISIIPGRFLPILGNNQETLQLLNTNGKIIDRVSYESAPEAQSYSLVNGKWQWVKIFSPGKINTLNIEQATKNLAGVTVNPNDPSKTILTGVIVTLPGMFSTQYFHVKPSNSEVLYQIYSSKKLFPELKIGQQITINGEISTIDTGQRLKITTAKDIQIIGESSITEPMISNSQEITKLPHPRFVRIEGEITSKKSPRLIITDTTGDIEVYLAKGTGLSISRFAVGDKVIITGITEMSNSTLKVMPRSEADITFLNDSSGPENTTSLDKISDKLNTSQRDNKRSLFIYLIIGGMGLAGLAGFIFWKYGTKK
ncbi:lamin tail domain-containing protein [Candidatus Falkowbacteria bacterium]|nr:MAG: lamin tail domain-containing protein [Candidatus Falkowbacteria bacterium]